MEIDIRYLLFLQNIRLSTGGVLDEIFNSISKIAVDLMIFMPYIIFWCVNAKMGYQAMSALLSGEVLNGIIKLTVCAYRPWIRSDQIEPAGDSKTAATGYSFPSGHTLVATLTYGYIYLFQKNKRKWLAVLCIILILLTGFSRNFLGVHTPQDVIVGLAEGVFVIWLVGVIRKKTEGKEKVLDWMTLGGILLTIAALVYVVNKPYPMDYVDGKLLVNPQTMMNDMFKACGAFIGFCIGSYVERHYLHFEVPVHAANLPMMGFVGFLIMFAWKEFLGPATVVAWFGGHWGNFICRLLMILFAVILWPIIIKRECREQR